MVFDKKTFGYAMYSMNGVDAKLSSNTKKNAIMIDFDWTLVKPKNNKRFPKDINDWEWLYPSVPEKVKEYNTKNNIIIIFTNQTKDWKHEQIKLVARELQVPIFIMIATNKKAHKPNIDFYNTFFELNEIDKKIFNLKKSLFIGDALGRKDDFSDSDKIFAENIGVKCISPEEAFLNCDTSNNNNKKNNNNNLDNSNDDKNSNIVLPNLPLYKTKPEIIIMVGIQGSGKSTIANAIGDVFDKKGNSKYEIIHGDDYKTSKKMIKKAKEILEENNNKSIVFDATNPSIKKRLEYIEFAKKFAPKHALKCFYIATPLNISFERNNRRPDSTRVPRVAFSVYNKNFEMPSAKEGFKLHIFYNELTCEFIDD